MNTAWEVYFDYRYQNIVPLFSYAWTTVLIPALECSNFSCCTAPISRDVSDSIVSHENTWVACNSNNQVTLIIAVKRFIAPLTVGTLVI